MLARCRAQHLAKAYGGRPVVKDVSLEVSEGEIVGLLGPNGAGKTTCFYMIVGLVDADAGDIQLDNQSLMRLPMHRRARAGIGYLPQEASVFRQLTVKDNPARNSGNPSELTRKTRDSSRSIAGRIQRQSSRRLSGSSALSWRTATS